MPYQVLYSSRATNALSKAELENILDDARRGNDERGITGVLVYKDGIFLQVLEGDREVLEALMHNISSDTRHEEVTVFHEAEVQTRSFRSWHMAYLAPSAEDLADWADLPGTVGIERLVEHVHDNAGRLPRVLLSIVEALADDPPGSTRSP